MSFSSSGQAQRNADRRQRYQEYVDSQDVTSICAHCGRRYRGTVGETTPLLREHLRDAHGIRRKRKGHGTATKA